MIKKLVHMIAVSGPDAGDRLVGYVCLVGLGFIAAMIAFGH